ncbi:hypothetical protein CRUP_014680, partial [Coryphaenoides rupestris]
MILLPPHRERANNPMYYTLAENGQNNHMQRALLQQVSPLFPGNPSAWSLEGDSKETVPYVPGGSTGGSVIMPPIPPRSFPPGHFLMHFDAFHHQNNDPPPALP